MLYPRSARFLFVCFFLKALAANGAREFSHWEEFDLPHPVCERNIPLAVGQESFFEIANEVPGRREFNELINLFHRRKWTELESAIAQFNERFETTPLREAVSFLEVQMLFDQEQARDEEQQKNAEKKLRGALLLYPKSDFGPVLSGTAGAYCLRTGNYQRSLAIYEMAVSQFPQSPLRCTFVLGIGETHFLLRRWSEAEAAFDYVLANCKNFRLRSAADIRKVDIHYAKKAKNVEKEYENVVSNHSPFIERFYQPTLANLGEIKYQAGKWTEAVYYFRRFLKTERTESPCIPFAMKRLADTAFRSGMKTEKVIGKYLEAYERSANSDIGKFCYAHALLMDPKIRSGPELERRARIVDEQAAAIHSENYRVRVYLEKALTLLDSGDLGALDYLETLRGKTPFEFEKGEAGRFIRKRIVSLFEAGSPYARNDWKTLHILEREYSTWLHGKPEAAWARGFYASTAAGQISDLVEKGNVKDAVARISAWKKSALWPKEGLNPGLQDRIGVSMLKALVGGGKDSEVAFVVNEERSALSTVLEPRYHIVLWLASVEVGGFTRSPAGSEELIGKKNIGLFHLASAQGFRLQGHYADADSALKGVSEREWRPLAGRERIELAKARRQGNRAFALLKAELAKAQAKGKAAVLKEMREVVSDLNVWSSAVELVDIAKAMITAREELGPYYHLAGRAMFEQKQCKQAIGYFENAFRMVPDSPQNAESRFRFGKCLLTEKKTQEAREQLRKVIDLKDTFWSPLAQSELELLPNKP